MKMKNIKYSLINLSGRNLRILNNISACIAILIVTAIILINIKQGFHWAPDSFVYDEISNLLLNVNLNLFSYLNQYDYVNQSYANLFPIYYVAILKLIIPNSWEVFIFFTNIVLLVGCFYLFYRTSRSLGISHISTSLVFIIFPACIEFTTWPRYYLTDIAYSFFVMLAVHLFLAKKNTRNYIYFPLICMFFTRLVAPAYIFSLLLYKFLVNKIRSLKDLGFLLLLLISVSLIIYTILIKYIDNFSEIKEGQIYIVIELLKSGWVIHDRVDYIFPNTFSHIEILTIVSLRFFSFFSPYAYSFSMVHIASNFVIFFAILFSTIRCIKLANQQGKNSNVYKYIFLIFILSTFIALFHAFTLIDYDWRYRFPLLLPMLISIGFNLDFLLLRVVNRE